MDTGIGFTFFLGRCFQDGREYHAAQTRAMLDQSARIRQPGILQFKRIKGDLSSTLHLFIKMSEIHYLLWELHR